jgi:predicted Zn-dependent protease
VDDGLKVLDEWVKLEPNNTQAWLYVGMAQAETNHPAAALTAFNQLVELAPDSVGYRVGQIQMLVELKRWDEAVKACDKVIPMHPVEGVLVWSLKAYSLAGLEKYDEDFKKLTFVTNP